LVIFNSLFIRQSPSFYRQKSKTLYIASCPKSSGEKTSTEELILRGINKKKIRLKIVEDYISKK